MYCFTEPETIETLQRMRRNGSKTTAGLKFYASFEFSVPDFLYGENF